jgi:predicted DNA-binding transcriptional regulator YafY
LTSVQNFLAPFASAAGADAAHPSGHSIRPYPNASTLAREMEVSTKSIHRDFEFMRDRLSCRLNSIHAQWLSLHREVSSVSHLQITEGELFALLVAEKALQQYRGTTFEKPLLSAFKKMEQALPDTISLNLADMGANDFLPHPRRADSEPEIFDALAKAAAQRNNCN